MAGNSTVDAQSQIPCRPAGTFTNLCSTVSSNTASVTTTARLRKNGGNANNTISITTLQTGTFEDVSGSDSFADGDTVNLSLSVAAGSGTVTFRTHSILFDAASLYRTQLSNNGSQSLAVASTTRYATITSIRDATTMAITTESLVQTLIKSSCTLKNLECYVTANSRAVATTVKIRKNSTDGSLSVSCTGSTTGRFEDTTHSDAIVADDLINYSITTGTGTGTISWYNFAVTIESSLSATYLTSNIAGGAIVNSNTTNYLSTSSLGLDPSESTYQLKTGLTGNLKNLTLNVSENTLDGSSTFRLRKSGANAAVSLSVGSSATGFFSDITNTETVSTTDLLNYQVVTGGSSGSITLRTANSEFYLLTQVTKTFTTLFDVDAAAVTYMSKAVSVLSTGGATQDITFTPNAGDPDWTPKVAIVSYSRGNTSQNTFQEHMSSGFGFTDGTNQRCVAVASEDNQARGDNATVQRDNALICALNPTGTIETVDCVATFNSWLTNGIRINWTDAPAANFYINVLFLGGDDITNVDVGTLMSGTGTGDISVTDKAYQADVGMFITGGTATLNSPTVGGFLSIGAATPASQWVQSIYEVDNPVTMSTRQYYSHTKVVVTHTTSVTGYATFTSFNSNGFTLNVGDAFAANIPIFYLIIKGGQYSVGNDTEPAGLGDQTITTNKDVKAVAVFGLDLGTADTVSNGCMQTIGIGDKDLNQLYLSYEDTNGVADSVVVSVSSYDAIYHNMTANATATSSTSDDYAALTAVSPTGLTLTWGNIGQARPYRYITFGKAIQLAEVTKTSTYLWDLYKEVVDTDTLMWDVVAEVTDTNTLKFDITVPVTDTDTFIYDVSQEITPKTLTLLHDILQAIPKTNTLRFDVFHELVDTNTFRFDITGEVLKSNSLLYNILTEVSKTNTFRYDIFMEVVKAYSLLHNVTVEMATAQVLNILFNVDVPVTATKTFRADISQEVTASNIIKYDVISELIKISTLIYDIELEALGTVTKTFTTIYNVDVPMLAAKTLTLLHNISQEVTTSKTFIYDVFHEVTKSGTLLHEVLQELIDTNTLRYDVTVQVEAAKTLIHNILQEVAKTDTFRFDVTVETLAKQLRLLHDIIGEVTKTETLKFNVDNIMTKTGSFLFDIYEGLVIIKAINLMFNVDQEFTTEPRSLNYNVDTEIAADTALPYNIDTEVIKTNSIPFEILQALTKTGTLRFDTIQETIRTASMIYNVMQEMVKTGTFVYDLEAVGQVIKTMSVIYNVDKILQTTPRVFNWNITKEVTKTRTFRFDVTVPVEAQFDILYSLFQQVIKGTDLRYDISKAVTKLFIGLYNISQAVTRTRTLKHNIQQETTKTGSFIYDVTVPMLTASAFNLVYDIMVELESSPRTFNYDIIAEITKSTRLLFDIYNAIMAAIKTATIVYNIDKTMTVSKTMRYDVTTRVDKTIRLVFDLLHKVVSRKVFRYSMESQVTRTRTFRFNVTNELRTESTFIFDVLNTVATENELLFNILASRTKQLKTRYAIQHEVSKTRTLRHNISQFIESTGRTFNWDLLQEIDKSNTLRYDISKEIAMRARFKWELLQELIKQNDIMFNLLQEVPEVDVSFRYDIIAQTTKLFKLYYDIDKTITKAHSFVYSIIPTTVITPKTALHERLLDYIMTQYNISDPPKNEILWHEWYNGLADITIDSIFLTAKVIPDRSTLIYKERVYRCAIHIFYRVGKPDETNANNPTEYVNVINHISNILSRSRFSLYYDLGYNVYEMRIADAFEIPDLYDPQNTEPVGKIRHYRFLIDLFYQKLIT